jgi:hypothetical protein
LKGRYNTRPAFRFSVSLTVESGRVGMLSLFIGGGIGISRLIQEYTNPIILNIIRPRVIGSFLGLIDTDLDRVNVQKIPG